MASCDTVHPITLAFRDRKLEQALSATALERTRHQGRVAMVLGMFLYLLAGILDQWFVPAQYAGDVWKIRLTAACVPALVLALTFTPWFSRLCHPLLAAVGLSAGISVIAIQMFLPLESAPYYYPTLVLVTFYTYNFVGTRFIHALWVDLLLLGTYNLVFGGLMDYPPHLLVSHDFFIVSANLIGGAAGYLAERQRRMLFLRERQLQEANLAKSRLFAAASHDLRQPIHALGLFLDTLKIARTPEDRTRTTGSMGLALKALQEMLDALLDVSKLDAGAVVPRPTEVRADDLFREIAESFDPVAKERALRFCLRFPGNVPAMHIDRRLLLCILNNLIGNAMKNTRKGGVLVALRRRGDGMAFQVWDTGIGIAEQHLERIFDEYYQIGNPERDRAKGMGLGLAIVRRICDLLELGLSCRSRPGKGSLFEVRIPPAAFHGRACPTPEAAPLPEVDLERFRGKRIVLVEDDTLVADALHDALGMHGADIRVFRDAEAALADPATEHADAFIVDHQLAGPMNGLEFLHAARKLCSKPVRAVVISGNTTQEFVGSVRELEWPLLFKPVNSRMILHALAS